MMTVKKTISSWPDKFQDTFPQNIETSRVYYFMLKLIPFNDSRKKEKF